VGGGLGVIRNDSLASLDGFSSLAEVGGSTAIQDNPALVSLDGLGCLASVGKTLYISDNSVLTTLGLSGLVTVGCEPDCWWEFEEDGDGGGVEYWYCDEPPVPCLQVASNPSLSQCEACDLLEQLSYFTLTFDFYDNQPDTCTDACD
jgi:hypothetical protein